MKPYNMPALLAAMTGGVGSMPEISVRKSPKNWAENTGSTGEQKRRLKQAKQKEKEDVTKVL